MQLTRRHRAVTLSLALIAGGVFFVFVTRVFLVGLGEEPRTCETSELFGNIPFEDLQRRYHWTVEQILEERMRLYEGETLLQCEAEIMEAVIPRGETAAQIAVSLPAFKNKIPHYSDFEFLLTEFWRTYDCHLFSLQSNPLLLEKVFPPENPDQEVLYSELLRASADVLGEERLRARATFDRLLWTIRTSEEYLPLHASLRCLQRGSVDVRNATALLSDASQCLPAKLGAAETSLLK